MPPEVRIKEFSNSGSFKMDFSKNLTIPDGTADLIKEQTDINRRRLAANAPPEASLITVLTVKEDVGDDPEIP